MILSVQVGNFIFVQPSQQKTDILCVNSSCLFCKLILVLMVFFTPSLSLTVVI